jgi:hypothetical protein
MSSEEIVYHYTSIDALINILKPDENQKICFWASHVEFMNDPDEYTFIFSLLKPSILKYEKDYGKTQELSKNLPENIGDRLLRLAPGPPFLLSLSNLENDLFMWRTYGAEGSGVSIGLDKNILLNEIDPKDGLNYNPNSFFRYCSYDKENNIKTMSDYWQSIYDALPGFIEHGRIEGKYFWRFLKLILNHCFSFKHKSYSYEQECRVCKYEHRPEEINYRVKNGVVIPYSHIYFSKDVIRRIWIGPSVNAEMSKKAILLLLKTYGYDFDESFVQVSKIPYRNL